MNGADIVRLRHLAIAAVTALVSTRVYGALLQPDATLPAVRVSLVSAAENLHLRGRSGVRVDRVQCDYYATSLSAARAVADAAYGGFVAGAATGLVGWTGSIGSPATMVDLIEPVSRFEAFEAEEQQAYIVTQDYYVHYRG